MMHGKKNFFENVPLIFCPGGKILITIIKIYKLILKKKTEFSLACIFLQFKTSALSPLQSNNRWGIYSYHRSTSLTRVKKLERKLKVLEKTRLRGSQNNS